MRTRAALAAVVARHASLAETEGTCWRGHAVQVVTEANDHLPLQILRRRDGATAVLGTPLGTVLTAPAGAASPSAAVAAAVLADQLIASEGRHVSVFESNEGEVRVGVDTLGFTPLYVWSDHELFAFASSPGLLLDSGLVRPRIDPHGLVCALMFGHMALSRTIWDGIRRPDVGRAVRWSAGTGMTEYPVKEILPSDAAFSRRYESLFDEFVDRLDAVVLPPAAGIGDDVALSLSGGVDSRLLAGVLQARRRTMPRGPVFGLPHEDEVRCARRVVSAVGSSLAIVPPREDRHVAQFLRIARQETLSASLWSMSFSASLAAFHPLPRWLVTGTFGDHMPGGCAPNDGYDAVNGRYSAARQITTTIRWGVSPRDITRLLPSRRIDAIVTECLEAMRVEWSRHPAEEFQQAWLWTTRHRMRFHLATGSWRQASLFTTYQPFAANEMVEFCAGLPLSAMQDRLLEKDYLRRRLPKLAALPLDRNSGDLTPLAPSLAYRVGNALERALVSRTSRTARPRPDRRTYHRTFDFDGPGWRPVREALEPLRRETQAFNRDVLDELLPPAMESSARSDSIIDGGKAKNLLALVYVLSEYGVNPAEATG